MPLARCTRHLTDGRRATPFASDHADSPMIPTAHPWYGSGGRSSQLRFQARAARVRLGAPVGYRVPSVGHRADRVVCALTVLVVPLTLECASEADGTQRRERGRGQSLACWQRVACTAGGQSPMSMDISAPCTGYAASARTLATAILCLIASCASAQTLPLSDRDIDNPTHWYLGIGEPGLYPGGANLPGGAHLAYGLNRTNAIRPLGSALLPSSAPAIGFVAVGMSNANQEWGRFAWLAANGARHNARVVLVDAAQGGIDATEMDEPGEPYWNFFDQRVAAAGLGLDQVQAVWLKQSIQGGAGVFPTGAATLQQSLAGIVDVLQAHCPNLQVILLSSRIWGAGEPWNFETAFAVKDLIRSQVDAISAGTESRPWLAWGPYLWADGLSPRSDGLFWDPALHLEADLTHPSAGGEQQVADRLDAYLATQYAFARWLFPAGGAAPITRTASADAHVDNTQPNTNFGADPALRWATGTRIYLRFDLSGLAAGLFERVRLVYRVESTPNGAGAGFAYLASPGAWSEATLNWANAPAPGTLIRSIPSTSRGGVVDLDVTAATQAALLAGSTSISLVLVPPAKVGFPGAVLSRESGESPVLLLSGPTLFVDGFEQGLGSIRSSGPSAD